MTHQPTPETDTVNAQGAGYAQRFYAMKTHARKMERERDEWKTALLRIHPTGRGLPDELATDIIEGIEAAKVAIIFLSGSAKGMARGLAAQDSESPTKQNG